ncbi:MAG: hypothetical protein ACYSWS_04190 [Planctomycetota bacterium]|jgi:hypothetical protein
MHTNLARKSMLYRYVVLEDVERDYTQIVEQKCFLECSDRVTVLIRIITDDALPISV